MKITYDPTKRASTLENRQLDFEDAAEIFNGLRFTFVDDRKDYGEIRNITAGLINKRMVIIVWTLRGTTHHIISMRKANVKEQKYYKKELRKEDLD
ncbi:MAG: BrnT family toxin [Rickettsiales bacterium]